MALWRIRATVDDRPGYLSVLTASLALRAVNILAVQVHTTEAGAVDDFLVDAPDSMTERDLLAAVEKGRGRDPWISPADAQVLVDPPTQALALGSRVVRDPEALGETLRLLLGGDAVVWRPSADPPRHGLDRSSMRLADPGGGAYEITRDMPAFTPAEYARAQALVDLAAAATRQAATRTALLLADGTELIVRPPTGEDLPALAAMHARCSPETRRRRYLTGTAGPSVAQLRRLVDRGGPIGLVAELTGDPDACAAAGPDARLVAGGGDGRLVAGGCDGRLVAGGRDGRLVAMATLVGEGDLAEVALLVEDAWQRRGLGTALLRRLAALAARGGYAALVAHTYADNVPMLRALRRLDPTAPVERDGALVTVSLALAPLARASRSSAGL
ncbi:MAG TPA: GNAT family N-acetyltransferase [Pilimelia sp.]|nr:GNAT family N-acetyltransferase [Pilimelia sp.]